MACFAFGEEAQMNQGIEECLELALAIRKCLRFDNEESFTNLVDEIADVEIMIEQIKFIHGQHGINELVEERKEFKLNRLNEMLEKLEENGK